MLNKLLIVFSLVFLLSNCKTVPTKEVISEEIPQEEFIGDEQPQDVREFEVIPEEGSAEKINEEVQEEIQEVEVPDRVLFDLNKSSLTSDAQSILNTQSEWLQSDESIKVIIEGHCDERGTREYNIALGEKRALAVKNYLISLGVDEDRISSVSYGKEKPAFVGASESVWSKNRRAVTVIK